MSCVVDSLDAERILHLLGQGTQARSEIRRHLQFLFRVLDSLHAGIIVIDRSSRILYANEGYGRIIGVPAHKVIGKSLAEIEPRALLLRSLEEGRPILDGYVALQSVDRRLICDHTPILDEAGTVVGAVATFRGADDSTALSIPAPAFLPPAGRGLPTLPVPFTSLAGKNWRLLETLMQAQRAAHSDCSVLVRGESGTGKELLAQAIHAESKRMGGPLVCVNCAAIPEQLLESELFGYAEGAFTGARRNGKPGKIELAHRGTLFLDEIGEMSPLMQAKLLRFIQERQIERVGATRLVRVDIRVISATHRNLEEMVAKGEFREDLYYRLNVVPLFLPSLRERRDDIPCLVDHLLQELSQRDGPRYRVSPAYLSRLMTHSWPGNVRELRNVLEYSAVMTESSTLEPEHLPRQLQTSVVDRLRTPSGKVWDAVREKVMSLERQAILEVIAAADGNRSVAIRMLGIGRATFYKKLADLGIDPGAVSMSPTRMRSPSSFTGHGGGSSPGASR